jgi:hypothetical protein
MSSASSFHVVGRDDTGDFFSSMVSLVVFNTCAGERGEALAIIYRVYEVQLALCG